MGENFNFQGIAEEVTKLLAKDKDEMTAFGISDNFISFGTFNGYVHFLFLETNEGILIGPYSPIKDISCLGDSVAYISGKQVTLYNIKNQRDTFSTTVQDPIKISICSSLLGNIALVCATIDAILIIQRGWVTTNTRTLKIRTQGIYELQAHCHLGCYADSTGVQILNLTTEEAIYETKVQRGIAKFHWMSQTTLLIVTGNSIQVLNYTQTQNKDTISLIDKIDLDFIPLSIASFNQSNIVLLSHKLIILNSQKEIVFSTIPPVTGHLLSNNRTNSPFFILGSNQIFKVELPNAKEKIKILVQELKFDKAYELTERFKLDYTEVLLPHIDHCMRANNFEQAAQLISQKLSPGDKSFIKIVESFIKARKLHLIAHCIPYIEDETFNNLIFTELNDHKDLLENYLKKWPLVMLTKSSVINKIKKIGFNDILIDNFIKLGKTTEALKIALDVKSKKCFEIIDKHPETFTLFMEIPNFLSELFTLDCVAAGILCESNKMEIPKVLEWLPSELIIKFLMSYKKLDLELEKILFQELLSNNPGSLIEFVGKIKFIDLEFILNTVKNTKLDELKIFIWRKLNNEEEVAKILRENFDVRLLYIKHYPGLWKETLEEAKYSTSKTKKVIEYLHYYPDSISYIKNLDFKGYEFEIKQYIKKQGKILDIYKNSLSAAKLEEFYEFRGLFKEYCKGIAFSPPFVCCKCAQPLTSVRLRKCGHHSHKDCFDECIFCIDPHFLNDC
jgi:hypothetical protein